MASAENEGRLGNGSYNNIVPTQFRSASWPLQFPETDTLLLIQLSINIRHTQAPD